RQRLVVGRHRAAATTELNDMPPLPVTNGDEERYLDRRASFSKTMPHNELGEVDETAYRTWLAILASGDPAQFEQVPRDPEAVERLNNPQATYAIDLVGPDATALTLEPPPAFASRAMAAEMAELYWRALMRDVPFREYDANPLVPAAIADLEALGYAQLSTTSLFRGETAGDRRGPLVSQFLWRDVPYGLQTIKQRYRAAPGDRGRGAADRHHRFHLHQHSKCLSSMAGKPHEGSRAIRKPAISPSSRCPRMRSPASAKRRSRRGATSSTPSRSSSIGWSQPFGASSPIGNDALRICPTESTSHYRERCPPDWVPLSWADLRSVLHHRPDDGV